MPMQRQTEQAQGQAQAQGQSQAQEGAKEELRARNAAGKQARESPLAEWQRPHRVHTSAERRAAEERKSQARLLEEASKKAVIEGQIQLSNDVEIEEQEQQGLDAVSLDEDRRRRRRQQEQDEPSQEQSKEESAARSLGLSEGASGKYFQDLPADRLGDPGLTNPNDMKRLLGPSVRFAQHAMMLADQRMKEGLPRDEALQFLASLYLGVSDRAYANKALRDFGAATGILDLYPLELMQHLLANVPSFLSKVSTAKLFAAVPAAGLTGEAGKPIVLRYDAELRIRGFAVRGGERPGYLFEPVDPPGTYHLTFATAGQYTCMVSALAKDGTLRLDELAVTIKPGDGKAIEASATFQKTRTLEGDDEAPGAAGGGPASTAAGGTPGPDEATPVPKPKKDLKFTIPRKI